jgi:hypothetical protein
LGTLVPAAAVEATPAAEMRVAETGCSEVQFDRQCMRPSIGVSQEGWGAVGGAAAADRAWVMFGTATSALNAIGRASSRVAVRRPGRVNSMASSLLG